MFESSAVSKLGQFRSLNVAPVHPAVQMSTWPQTVVDVLMRRAVITSWFMLPREVEMALE